MEIKKWLKDIGVDKLKQRMEQTCQIRKQLLSIYSTRIVCDLQVNYWCYAHFCERKGKYVNVFAAATQKITRQHNASLSAA